MPDITLCTNKECQFAMICERFLAAPSIAQYYALFEPVGNECEYFIELKEK